MAQVNSITGVIPDHQKENADIIRKKLAPLLKDLEVEPEDVDFSWKALNKTLKGIQFKLQGREDNELDQLQIAGNLVKSFREQSRKVSPRLAEQRLEIFSQLLFTDYRNLMSELKANADVKLVRLEEIPEELLFLIFL